MTAAGTAASEPAVARQPDGLALRALRALERRVDGVCGERNNPLRQLGGLGFQLFWLIAVSGAYLYVFYDTSVADAWRSVDRLTHGQWWAGGVMRSFHRYASDAFVLVVVIHLLRELAYGHHRGFRWYSWVSGVPTLWLAVASGVIGYWLVWDTLAQFIGVTVTEWFGALPGFGPALVRNFIADAAMSDRFFSLLAFLHIGVPLVLLLAMWIHVQRLTRPRTGVSRGVGAATLGALLALSLLRPATSQAPADLARVPAVVPIDWFYLAPLPAVQESSAGLVWAVVVGLTLLLFAAPWLGRRSPRPPPARVDPPHCSGCARCFDDCPYEAITMAPHPGGRGMIAVVADDLCASCGICAGACPSSTPFRSDELLISGIDLPDRRLGELRDRVAAGLAAAQPHAQPQPPRPLHAQPQHSTAHSTEHPTEHPQPLILLFHCELGASPRDPASAASDDLRGNVLDFALPCAGMLPPSFVEFALRHGADGVLVVACPDQDCEYRFGVRWTRDRLERVREPRLRASVPDERLRLVHAAREDPAGLRSAISAFRAHLAALPERVPESGRERPRPRERT